MMAFCLTYARTYSWHRCTDSPLVDCSLGDRWSLRLHLCLSYMASPFVVYNQKISIKATWICCQVNGSLLDVKTALDPQRLIPPSKATNSSHVLSVWIPGISGANSNTRWANIPILWCALEPAMCAYFFYSIVLLKKNIIGISQYYQTQHYTNCTVIVCLNQHLWLFQLKSIYTSNKQIRLTLKWCTEEHWITLC